MPGDQAVLRVALDVSAVPVDPAGAGRYIIELVRALSSRNDLNLELVCRRHDSERWRLLAPGAGLSAVVPDSRPLRLAYERLLLGRRLDRLGVDVYHGPHYTMASTTETRRVVTVHDLTFLEHPEWHERSKVPVFQAAIRRAAREADVVICVSATTARRLRELLEVRAEIAVAEHGVDHDRFTPGDVDLAALPEGLGLADSRLIVHVGTLEPRKGIVDLVQAFDSLASEKPELRLVLAGLPGWGAREVTAAIEATVHRDRIRTLGWVSDAAVVALMRAAAAVVYPSHEEGFGLPALEAMATGAPLVTSRGTAMSEFAGEAAWLAPAGDPAALAAAISAVLGASAEERARRREEGLARARPYTWERTAAEHVRAYQLATMGASPEPGPSRSDI